MKKWLSGCPEGILVGLKSCHSDSLCYNHSGTDSTRTWDHLAVFLALRMEATYAATRLRSREGLDPPNLLLVGNTNIFHTDVRYRSRGPPAMPPSQTGQQLEKEPTAARDDGYLNFQFFTST